MKISTEVLITASLSKVWGALVDFPRYRSWHPLVEIEGSAKEGADVEYYYRSNSEAPRGMSMTDRKALVSLGEVTKFAWSVEYTPPMGGMGKAMDLIFVGTLFNQLMEDSLTILKDRIENAR